MAEQQAQERWKAEATPEEAPAGRTQRLFPYLVAVVAVAAFILIGTRSRRLARTSLIEQHEEALRTEVERQYRPK